MAAATAFDSQSNSRANATAATHHPQTFTIRDMLGSLGITPASSSTLLPPPATLEYLFEDEYVNHEPSFGSRLCYGTGMTYLSGKCDMSFYC